MRGREEFGIRDMGDVRKRSWEAGINGKWRKAGTGKDR